MSSTTTDAAGAAPILFIAVTVTLDAMGIGLILPVMPALITELNGNSIANAATIGGWLTAAYAIMQFLCGPLLGNLSDRYGRRPVLIVSLFFMGLDYLLIASATALWVLFIARLISGITGATYATAAAYLADISEKGERSKNFGYIGAAFGLGFILGPVVGGLLGEFGSHWPFLVAGALALMNALFGYFVLPETLTENNRRKFEWHRANPFKALLRIKGMPLVGGLTLVLFIHSVSNNVYAAIWSFYTIELFGWATFMVGISLTIYGIFAVLTQGVFLGFLINKIGEYKTALLGIVISILSLVVLTVLDSATLLFLGMPIMALGALVGPALQGMMSDRVSENEQGELQGIFASTFAVSTIVSPLLMTYVFQYFTQEGTPLYLPGAPYAAAAVLGLASLILYLRVERPSD